MDKKFKAATPKETRDIVLVTLLAFTFIGVSGPIGRMLFAEGGVLPITNNKVEVHYPSRYDRCMAKYQVAPLRPTLKDVTFRGNFAERFNTLGRVTPAEFNAAHPELCNEFK